jgi:hypothetical protein
MTRPNKPKTRSVDSHTNPQSRAFGTAVQFLAMPQGDKSSYTAKQKRQAQHIEESYRKRGVGSKESEKRAWKTVNKQTGGGRKKSAGKQKTSRASKAARP